LAGALCARAEAVNNLNAVREKQAAEWWIMTKVIELDAFWTEKKKQ
jgi:hypothetical protein